MVVVRFFSPKLIQFQEPKAFDQRVRQWLTFREAENSYFFSQLVELTSGHYLENVRMFTIDDGMSILLAGMLFSNGTLCTTWGTKELVEIIANQAEKENWQISNVFSPGHFSWLLGTELAKRTGRHAEANRAERAFQITRCSFELPPHGHLEVATERDKTLVRDWVEGFVEEAAYENKNVDAIVHALITSRLLYLWKCPEPVAMAAWVAPTPNGGSINFVYTPPELRGQGYGKAVSAALAEQMLASGLRYCFVLTDIKDARTNSLYQAIGGISVAEFLRCSLVAPPMTSAGLASGSTAHGRIGR